MKKIPLVLLFLLVFALFPTSCSDPEPIPAELPEGSITTRNVQISGSKYMIANDKYVFSAQKLGIKGTGKINLLTNRVTNVCIQPGCTHKLPHNIDIPGYCHIPATSDLLFVVEEEIFYRYYNHLVDYDKADNNEPDNREVIQIFASYNITTGEYREILTMKMTEFEYMFNFIHHKGYIYYNRQVAKVDRPEKKEDYRFCCCRMKIGEYKEEILFAFEDVCTLPDGVLPDLFAMDQDKIWFACPGNGQLLEVDSKTGEARFHLGENDGIFVTFDSPAAYYCDGYCYFTATIPKLKGEAAYRAIFELYRLNCATGETEKLTEDYVMWLFVSDQKLYYAMAFNYQSTEERLSEVGNDYSLLTIKEMGHDGKDVHTLKCQMTSPYLTLSTVVGAGDALYFLAGYNDGKNLDEYTVIFNLKTGEVTELGRSVGVPS